MKAATMAVLGLMLATGIARPQATPGFVFVPGHEYTYQVQIKRRPRDAKSPQAWTGEMKVWPIEQRPDGQVLVRARIAMNPDRPAGAPAPKQSAVISWTEFDLDPSGQSPAGYEFVPDSDKAPTLPLTFPLPPAGQTQWKAIRPGGAEIDYRFAAGSSSGQPLWEIEAGLRDSSPSAADSRLSEHYTYDPKAARLVKWTDRGEYAAGEYRWTATTLAFKGERALAPGEQARLDHDSQLLHEVMTEFDHLSDEAENPIDDLDTYQLELRAMSDRAIGLLPLLQDPQFHEDYTVFTSGPLASLAAQTDAAIQRRDALLDHPSPDWTAPDLAGARHALKDYRGKVVLLDFWSATSDPDQRSAPALNQLAHDYAGRPFVLLGLDVGDSPEVMRAAAGKLPLAGVQLAGEPVAQAYDLASVPAFVLIDAAGIVRARHLDWSDRSDAQLRKEIDALLARMPATKSP